MSLEGSGDFGTIPTTTHCSCSMNCSMANDDTYEFNENSGANLVVAPGVLSNDTDPDADSLSAIAETGPAHGTLDLNADGSFT